jgi:hypothetical protein
MKISVVPDIPKSPQQGQISSSDPGKGVLFVGPVCLGYEKPQPCKTGLRQRSAVNFLEAVNMTTDETLEAVNMTTDETTTLTSETLMMIRTFREANPDKRDQHLSASEFLQKNAHRIRWIGPLFTASEAAIVADQ